MHCSLATSKVRWSAYREGLLLEGPEPLLNRLLGVIRTPARLGAAQQPPLRAREAQRELCMAAALRVVTQQPRVGAGLWAIGDARTQQSNALSVALWALGLGGFVKLSCYRVSV
jgi:hypothetical protein